MSIGKIVRKALPYANVVNSGQATNQISVGKTLNNLQLQLAGTAFTKTMIAMFRLKANAKTIFEGSGDQIDKINAYRGMTPNAAFLDVAFEDLTGLDQLDRAVGALDTSSGIVSLTSEVDIVGATSPILTAQLHESAPQRDTSGNLTAYSGLIAKQLRYGFSISAAGELPLNFPFGRNGAIIKRVHVFHTGHVIGALVKEDGIIIHESVRAQNEYEQIRNGRVPQNNVYTIDFIPDGNVRNAFDTRRAQSVEWIFTTDLADSGYVVIEYLDTLGNL